MRPARPWRALPRPLDRLTSIKVKLGVVIVATVCVTVLALYLGYYADWTLELRVALAVVIGLAMVFVLARGMTSPLREMVDATADMAHGKYARRVRATSRDEVGDLARAFNAMAAELADGDRHRRELVANVSHELRTPIGALQALLENLVDGVEPPDPQTLSVALAQTERLGRLVSQLLDLSKWESGAPIEREQFAVRPLLEQATRELSLGEHCVHLKVCVQPGDLCASGDPERVHQVVVNLLENAIRHSPADGRVWLSAHRENGHIMIAVADEGPGIPPHEAQRVFDTARRPRRRPGGEPVRPLGTRRARRLQPGPRACPRRARALSRAQIDARAGPPLDVLPAQPAGARRRRPPWTTGEADAPADGRRRGSQC